VFLATSIQEDAIFTKSFLEEFFPNAMNMPRKAPNNIEAIVSSKVTKAPLRRASLTFQTVFQ